MANDLTIPVGMVADADFRDRLAMAISNGSWSSLAEFREWASNHSTYPNAYKSTVDDRFAAADRVIAMLAAAPKQAEQQGVEIARLREALAAEDDYWAASRAHASAFARIRPQTQAVFDAATRRRDAARAALNAPTGAVEAKA